jgi:hypothetical protein
MTYRNAASVAMLVLLVFGICSTISGQTTAKNSGAPIGPISNIVDQQIHALGKRIKTSGKEKTVYTGLLFDKDGKSTPARVIHQLPDLIRLEGFKGQGGPISFNGKKRYGISSRKKDESLLEIFTSDFPEGMLDALQNGAAVRLLGRGFGPAPSVTPGYTGPRYDIYEVAATVNCREDQLMRLKRYYFDTNSGLLQSTRYTDGSGSSAVKMETRYSVWGTIDGSAYPARIEHYENGQLIFTFIAESIAGEASADSSIFQIGSEEE